MKSLLIVGAAVVVAALAVVRAEGTAQDKAPAKKDVIFASADKATYKEVMPGVSKANLWGEPDKGPYGAFTKFAAGFDAGVHTHTSDLWIVVLKGAYVFRTEEGEKRVETGSFIRIPGGTKHRSGGDAKEGALFYEESAGKFDLLPVK